MKKKIYSVLFAALMFGVAMNVSADVTVFGANGITDGTSYLTLKGAFDAINTKSTQAGMDILVKINSSTDEGASSAILNQPTTSTWNTLKIYPTAPNLTITGSAGGTISLTGADKVTIDGRVNMTGSTKSLTIASTATGNASTILLSTSAEDNTIQYCIIRGNTPASAGTVRFTAAGAGNGNDRNVITHNTITGLDDNALTRRATNAIYITGAALYKNDNCQITYNDFPQFLQPAGASNGILLADVNSSGLIISDNNFYEETGTLIPTGNGIMTAIQINGGNGYVISNNYIGGSAASCGGGQLTKTNAYSNTFNAFYFVSLATGGTVTSVQNNTIKNISWSNSGTNAFRGMYVGSGDVNIGTVTGNTIGASTGVNSIIYTPTGAANFKGIETVSSGTVAIQNNTIGSIKTNNGSASATTFDGITKSNVAGTLTISNNLIGSLTEANSINVSTVVTTQVVSGINCAGSTGINTISNNTISNITNATTTSGSTNGIRVGAGTTNATTVNANFIQKLYLPSSTSSSIFGINIVGGLGTYTNNIVSIGYGSTDVATIYGIYDTGTSANPCNVYHNTVVIGGSPASGLRNSIALFSAAYANTRDFRNNILYNERSNSGAATGNHYAIYLNYTTVGTLTLDYNIYSATAATNAYAGYYSNATIAKTVSVIVSGQDAGSVNTTPVFSDAAAGSSIYDFGTTAVFNGASVGITTDILNWTRNSFRIGAFEHNSVTVPIANAVDNSATRIARNANGVVASFDGLANVELYTANGKLIDKTVANGTYSRNLVSGIYILRVNGKATKFVK